PSPGALPPRSIVCARSSPPTSQSGLGSRRLPPAPRICPEDMGEARMMMPQTPYSSDLDEREPLGAMNETLQRLRTLAKWPPAQFEESYAPGKWTARQILMHLAQSEMVLGSRARLALATPN